MSLIQKCPHFRGFGIEGFPVITLEPYYNYMYNTCMHMHTHLQTYLSPPLNSFMIASLSFCGISPCMEDTVKLASLIFSVNHSTFLFVLQKMTACVMVSVSYKSHRVSNFHSSFSTATKNCLIPSKVSSSLQREDYERQRRYLSYPYRFTRIRIGSVINFLVISRIS